ncbi:MAG: AAA family ATPase [Bacteroidales bacterium]|nr:AAA family ATPase [Bacteroidales bacterium]
MANEQQVVQVQQQQPMETESVSELNIRDLISACFDKWYWFVISVVLCMSIATLYILMTQKSYTREAMIMIKSNSKGASSIDYGMDDFSNLGLFNTKSGVNDELIAIQSPSIITEVVKRLNLDYSYQQDGTFRNTVLYGATNPIKADIVDVADLFGASFKMTINPDSSFVLTKFRWAAEGQPMEDDNEYRGNTGSPVETPIGQVIISKTANFEELIKEPTIIYISHGSILDVVAGCQASLVAELKDKMASVIDLKYTDKHIQRAEDFLNTLIAVYNEKWVEDKNVIAVSTSQFINDRLQVIEQDLGSVDNDISSYKRDNLIPDISAATNMYMTQANTINNKIGELETQLYMARTIKTYVNDTTKGYQLLPTYASPSGTSSSEQQQITDYNKGVLEHNSLLANTSAKNPLVKELEAKLNEMRKNVGMSMDNQILFLNAEINTLKSTLNSSLSHMAKNPDQAKYLLSVERQQKVKEALYLFLLQKREENELSQAFTAYNTRIICPPYGVMRPTAPSKMKVLGIALVLSLMFPLGLIYLIEANDTRVRNRKDLEGMKTPFVGEIPLHTKKLGFWAKVKDKITKVITFIKVKIFHARIKEDDTKRPIVVKVGSKSVSAEAFRVLRSNIEFVNSSREHKTEGGEVMIISSMMAGSGKTYITTNLAASFAIKDRKTIVVDLDLRKRTFSMNVGDPDENNPGKYIQPERGVSTYLAGYDDDWHDLVMPLEIPKAKHKARKKKKQESEHKETATSKKMKKDLKEACLYVLPAGEIPPNPAELLNTQNFKQLIAELKKEYEVIILDAPPVEIVADTAIIAKEADSTLFVIRNGLLEREYLPVVDRYYTEHKMPNVEIILNGGTFKKYGRYGYGKYGYGSYGYGYGGYGYGYGYGYGGYGSNDDEEEVED